MKLYKFLYGSVALFMAAAATGCSDSDDWAPGPEDKQTGVEAYFATPSTTSYIFSSDAHSLDIPVTVERKITEGEATVGLIFKSDTDGFVCPQTVTFADGESTAEVLIDCSGIPDGTIYNCSLTLDPDNTFIYGDGLTALQFSAIKADWRLIADNVRYLYSDWDGYAIYPSTYSMMYQLEGTYIFKLDDFFGSGLAVTFECPTVDTPVMMPMQNADFENVYDDDKADLGWYLYDEANVVWPEWTPGDAEGYPAISYLLLYASPDYNALHMIYNQKTLYGYIGLTTGIDFDNGNFMWGNFQVDFNLMYNPFEN